MLLLTEISPALSLFIAFYGIEMDNSNSSNITTVFAGFTGQLEQEADLRDVSERDVCSFLH